MHNKFCFISYSYTILFPFQSTAFQWFGKRSNGQICQEFLHYLAYCSMKFTATANTPLPQIKVWMSSMVLLGFAMTVAVVHQIWKINVECVVSPSAIIQEAYNAVSFMLK